MKGNNNNDNKNSQGALNLKWYKEKFKMPFMLIPMLIVTLIVSASASIAIAYVLKLYIDIANNQSNFTLMQATWFSMLILVIGGLSSVFANFLRIRIISDNEKQLREKILLNIFYSKNNYNSTLRKGDFISRLTTDVETICKFMPEFITEVVGSIFILVLALISMFILSPEISLAILVIIPLLVLFLSIFNIPIGRADKDRKLKEDDNRTLMEDCISNIKVIKANHFKENIMDKLKDTFSIGVRSKIKFGLWEGIAIFFNNMISTLMILITLGVGSFIVLKGGATLGTLVAIVQLLNYIINPISKISHQLSKIVQKNNSIERISNLIEIDDLASNHISTKFQTKDISKICLQNVYFSYGEQVILFDFNYIFNAGNIYCITGENGSGKSTLINIICGILPNYGGSVYFENNCGEKLTKDLVDLGVIFPDEVPFSGSVIDNITMFNKKDKKRFYSIAQNCSWVRKFLDSEGNGNFLERYIDKSTQALSSGQMKKIILSRIALYNNDVIILDEPSVNLDQDTKNILIEFLLYMKKTGSIIIITSHDEMMIDISDFKISLLKK